MNLTVPEKLKRSTFVLGSATLASTVLSLMFVGCSSERQSGSAAPETVSNVSVVSAQTANIPDVVEAIGTLRAAETSQLAAQMMGNIVEIRVREGDHVQRGQVLALIDDAQPRAALDRLNGRIEPLQFQATRQLPNRPGRMVQLDKPFHIQHLPAELRTIDGPDSGPG